MKKVSPPVHDTVIFFLEDILNLHNAPSLDDNLFNDLGMDSIDRMEFVENIEQLYNISVPDESAEFPNTMTVGELVSWTEDMVTNLK